jgi:transmembrane sensor
MMDRVYDFPHRETIEQEAAEWLVRLDGDTPLRKEELQALNEWMHRSPLHKEELESLGEFWSNQSLVDLPISLESLYCEASPSVQREWYRRPQLVVAASFVVFALFASFLYQDSAPQIPANNTVMYATAVGQQETIHLSDGSVVTLNTNSQIQVDYNRQNRNIVLLQGEANFDVAKDVNRPFRVYAGRGRVEAVGTVFNVYYRDSEDVDVTVTEGKVALGVLTKSSENVDDMSLPSNEEASLNEPELKSPEYYLAISVEELGELEAGQTTTILVAQTSHTKPALQLDGVKTIEKSEIERRVAWQSGLLVFKGNSLEEVVAEISRYTTLSIEIIDPELKKVRIGGRFNLASTSKIFDALEANFGLEVTRMDYNRVQISSSRKHNVN